MIEMMMMTIICMTIMTLMTIMMKMMMTGRRERGAVSSDMETITH